MNTFYIVMNYIYFFYIGALFASFLHVLISRNFDQSCLHSRSVCDSCKHQLRFFEVLPLIGYLVNKGQCRYCKSKISITYFLSELIIGLLFLSGYVLLDFSIDYFIYLIAIMVLSIESISDFKNTLVIDKVWIIGVVILIVIRLIQGVLLTYLFASFSMFTLLYGVAIIGDRIFKKESLGGGDIKLYLFIGMVLDLRLALLSLFLASVFGLVYAMIKKSKSDTYLPLVPFISLGVFVSYFWGNDLINWYLGLLGI